MGKSANLFADYSIQKDSIINNLYVNIKYQLMI